MPTLAARSLAIHNGIIGGTYNAPATSNLRQMLASLRAAGIVTATGAYLPGKSQADLTRELAVASIHSESMHRLADALGL